MRLFGRATIQALAAIAAFAPIALLYAAPASAQATRTWVSGVGNDANPCSRTARCQTFFGAFGKTAAGGEIDCLDPGGFGDLDITHAISIVCDGVSNGGVSVPAGGALNINAGPSDTVVLSGIDIDGDGTGTTGITFVTGQALYVRNCVIRALTEEGVLVVPTQTTPMAIDIDNTTITNTATAPGIQQAGIYIQPQSSGSVSVTINQTKVTGGYFGIVADGTRGTSTISGVVRDSVVSGNVQNGITVSNSLSPNVSLLVDNVAVTSNGNLGLAAAGPNAGMLVSNSTITRNGGGLRVANSGVLVSYGNNRVNANNGNDGAFSSTIAQK